MDASDPKTYLWQNICRMMGADPDGKTPSIDVVRARVKVGRGTVQRIKDGEGGTRLDSLVAIAKSLGTPTWRLLLPPDGPGQLSPEALAVARLYDQLAAQNDRYSVRFLAEALNSATGPSVTAESTAHAQAPGPTAGPVQGPGKSA